MPLELLKHDQQYSYKYRNHLYALTNGPLVYLATFKCASTFFNRNLRNWQWSEIPFTEINWADQRVFSHIMDPWERRHKGIAEYLNMSECIDLWYENERFRNMLRSVPTLDEHSASYMDTYGNYAWMIDWIPLQPNHDDTVNLTERLLYTYGTRLFKWDYDLSHIGDDRKRQLSEDIKRHWDVARQHTQFSDVYFERDRILYSSVMRDFNPAADTWERTSWLNKQTTRQY